MTSHITDDIKAVFFDHDDTLVDTIGTKWKQHQFIAKKYYGITLKKADIRKHWGNALEELMRLLYNTDDIEQAMAYTMTHHEEFPKGLYPEAIPTIKRLHTAGKTIGIVTATVRVSFEHDLTLHKFPKTMIDYTQTAEDTEFHKPDPRVFDPAIKWLKKRGIQPNETIYIGDSYKDMQAALGVGFNFLGVETGLTTAEKFKSLGGHSVPGIDYVFKD